jgi:NitT/TauT family transport system permease protein
MTGGTIARTTALARRRGARAALARTLRTRASWVLAALLIVGLWQLSTLFLPDYVVPSLAAIGESLIDLLGESSSYTAILDTLTRILGGFLVSATLGVLVGVALALWGPVRAVGMPLVKFTLGVPALTWVLLAIIWFTSTEVRVWFVMVALVFPIVTVNTFDGIQAVPRDQYDMVKSFRAGTWRLLRLVVIPASLPSIFSGFRVALSFASRIAVFAEALSTASGIGMEMYHANQTFDTALIIAWTIVLIAILAILNRVLEAIEAHWFRWRADFAR